MGGEEYIYFELAILFLVVLKFGTYECVFFWDISALLCSNQLKFLEN